MKIDSSDFKTYLLKNNITFKIYILEEKNIVKYIRELALNNEYIKTLYRQYGDGGFRTVFIYCREINKSMKTVIEDGDYRFVCPYKKPIGCNTYACPLKLLLNYFLQKYYTNN